MSRIIRAIQFDPQVYSEVASDKAALLLTVMLALLSSLATGVGGASGYPREIPYIAMKALIAWIVWIATIYIVGAKLVPGATPKPEIGAVFRVCALASAPGLLRLLSYLPPFSVIAAAGAMLWMFGTTAVAVQQVFRYRSLLPAVGINVIGFLVYLWLFYTM